PVAEPAAVATPAVTPCRRQRDAGLRLGGSIRLGWSAIDVASGDVRLRPCDGVGQGAICATILAR
ncbi:MAG: hypothetical protein M3O34_15585, partial [Chloroflexota bacterium]|nr:hypothetical protein [Chloroflexota bacterium]